jgi:nucleoside-diphosphate-sugar epimerase
VIRILVTGGTGYVGSHAVAALVRGGHEVRLLVRSPERIAPALAPHGIGGEVEHAIGDVTDAATVGAAIDGCDAVLHAASVYSLDARDREAMGRVNVPGTEIVLGEAARRGLDPIVYVSSTAAFLPGEGAIDPDSPPGSPATAYSRTKADAERAARAAQERGAPVAIVSPGAVFGPDDPHLGQMHLLLRDLLKRRLPVAPRGGFHAVDVRDVAATLSALAEPGRGPRRFLVPGHSVTIAEIAAELSALTERRLPCLSVPAAGLRPMGRVADRVARVAPFRMPVSWEGISTTGCDLKVDDSRAREQLGIGPRPFAETLADSVRWLRDEGRIRPREAGSLA